MPGHYGKKMKKPSMVKKAKKKKIRRKIMPKKKGKKIHCKADEDSSCSFSKGQDYEQQTLLN